jgi:glycopeptide antibiotics resistance protein
LLAASAVVIGYATLFPFDFRLEGASPTGAISDLDWTFAESYVVTDMLLNVVLFLPFGFAAAGVLASRGIGRRGALVGAVIAATACSFVVELAQAMLLVRFASVADVVANGLGGTLGAILYLHVRRSTSSTAPRAVTWLRRTCTVRRLAAAYLLALAIALAGSSWLSTRMRTSDWDSTYPLMIGNERTGDRPWAGVVSSFSLFDRWLSTEELDAFGRTARVPDGASLLADNDFTAEPSGVPEFTARGAGGERTAAGIVVGDGWLQSVGPADAISRAIGRTSEFTLSLHVATRSLDQSGPARIVTVSDGLFRRNLTVAQDGPDLVVRVRTPFLGPDGTDPELAAPNVFADEQTHHVVVRFDAGRVRVDVRDTRLSHSLDLTPEGTALFAAFPNRIERLHLSGTSQAVFWATYRLVLLGPAAVLGAFAWRRRGDDPRALLVVGGTAALGALALELASLGRVDLAAIGMRTTLDAIAIGLAAWVILRVSGGVRIADPISS